MKILYIGDIMGDAGIETVSLILPDLKNEKKIDFVIAQSENVSGGKGMLPSDMIKLQKIGIDFFTGGNHTPKRVELNDYLEDDTKPVIGPANLIDCPGKGYKYIDTKKGKILVISLLGDTVGDNSHNIENPLQKIDFILHENKSASKAATVINFHGDFSSQKRIIGYYLDGMVTAVIGDHWHVPTADAMVLPKGTAHISDVGMCGSLHSSLGVSFDSVTPRWRDNVLTKNIMDYDKPWQFNAVLIEADEKTGLAYNIERINRVIAR